MENYPLPSWISPQELLRLISELPSHPQGELGLDPLFLAADATAMRLLGDAVGDAIHHDPIETSGGFARGPMSTSRVTVLASSGAELHRMTPASGAGDSQSVRLSESIDFALVHDSLSDELFLIGIGMGPPSIDQAHSYSSELSATASRSSFSQQSSTSPSQQRRQRKPTFAANTASSPQLHGGGSSTSSRFAAPRSQVFRGTPEAQKEVRFCVPLGQCRALSFQRSTCSGNDTNTSHTDSPSRSDQVDRDQRYTFVGLSWSRSSRGSAKTALSGLQPWLVTGVASQLVSVLVSASQFRSGAWCLEGEEEEESSRGTSQVGKGSSRRRGILLHTYSPQGIVMRPSSGASNTTSGQVDFASLNAKMKTEILYDYHATVVEVLGQQLVTIPTTAGTSTVPPSRSPTSSSSSASSKALPLRRGANDWAIRFATMHLLAPYAQAHTAGVLNIRSICKGLTLTANWSEDPEVQRGMAQWEQRGSTPQSGSVSAADAASFRSCGPFCAVLVQEVGLLLIHESLLLQEGAESGTVGGDALIGARALSQQLLSVTTPCDFATGVFLVSPQILLRALLPPPSPSLAPPEEVERSPPRGHSFRAPPASPLSDSTPLQNAQQLRELVLELGDPFESVHSPFSSVATTAVGSPLPRTNTSGHLVSKASSFKAASVSPPRAVNQPRPSIASLNLDGPPQCLRSRIHLTFSSPENDSGAKEMKRPEETTSAHPTSSSTNSSSNSMRSQFLEHLQFIAQVHGTCLVLDTVPVPNLAESIWLQAGLLTADPFMCEYLEWNPQKLLVVGSSYLTCSQTSVAALAERPACVVLQTLLENNVEQLAELLLSVVPRGRERSAAVTGDERSRSSAHHEADLARACIVLTSATEPHVDPHSGKGFKIGHLYPTLDGLIRLVRLVLERPCAQMRQYRLASELNDSSDRTRPESASVSVGGHQPSNIKTRQSGSPAAIDQSEKDEVGSIPFPLLSLQRLVHSMMEPSTFEAEVLYGYLYPELANTVYAAYEHSLNRSFGLGLQRKSLSSPRLFPPGGQSTGSSTTSGDALSKSGSIQQHSRRTSIKERNRSLSTSQGFPNLARAIQDFSREQVYDAANSTSEGASEKEKGNKDAELNDDGSEDMDDEADEVLEMLSARLQSVIDRLDFGPRLRWVMNEAKEASIGILHRQINSSRPENHPSRLDERHPDERKEILSSPEVQLLFPQPFVVQQLTTNVIVPTLSQLIQKRLDHAKTEMTMGLPSGKNKPPQTPVVIPSVHDSEVRRLVQERLQSAFVDSFHWTMENMMNLSGRRDSTNSTGTLEGRGAAGGGQAVSTSTTADPLDSPLLPPRLVVSKLSLLAIPTWIRVARLIDRHSTSLLLHFLQQPTLEQSSHKCTQWLLSLFPIPPSVRGPASNPAKASPPLGSAERQGALSLSLSYGRLTNPAMAPKEICFGVAQQVQTELSITKDSEPAAHNLVKLATATATLSKVVEGVVQQGLGQPFRVQSGVATVGQSAGNALAAEKREESAKTTTSTASTSGEDSKLRVLEEENRSLRLQLEEVAGVAQQKLSAVQRAEARLAHNMKFLYEKEQHIFLREEALFREQLSMEERNERLGRFLLAMHGFDPSHGKEKPN